MRECPTCMEYRTENLNLRNEVHKFREQVIKSEYLRKKEINEIKAENVELKAEMKIIVQKIKRFEEWITQS